MDKFKELLLKHPTRSKYLLVVFNIFFILVSTKIFINYTNIEDTIQKTIIERELRQEQLAFTKNFQLEYEKSEYSDFFLKHENNILKKNEIIVQLQTIKKTINSWENENITKKHIIESPKESRKQFFWERLK